MRRRISLALALLSAMAAAGCSRGARDSTGQSPGTPGSTFTVTVRVLGTGTVTSGTLDGGVFTADGKISCTAGTCSADYVWGIANLALTQTTGQYFNGWSGDCSGQENCTLSGNADKYVVASFSATPRTHPNWSDPVVHAAKAKSGALVCSDCHGAKLQGQGLAPSCLTCHARAAAVNDSTCLSALCHGNTALAKTVSNGSTVPLYVDRAAYAKTVHGMLECVSCHSDIVLTNGVHAGTDPSAKTYGGWARFDSSLPVPSPKDAIPPRNCNPTVDPTGCVGKLPDAAVEGWAAGVQPATRNYYTAAAMSCFGSCHANKASFATSAHRTIYKQKAATIDPALTYYAQEVGLESTTYRAGEYYYKGDCNRCHSTCATCHFRSTISLKDAAGEPIAKYWDAVQATDKLGPGPDGIFGTADDVPTRDSMSEYRMDWTTNVASHEFRTKPYFATDSERLCEACHTGYNRPAKNAYYWIVEPPANPTDVTDYTGGTAGKVKATNVRRHPQATELQISGGAWSALTAGANTIHGGFACGDCHGTSAGASGNVHALPGTVPESSYKWSEQGDVQCTTCHVGSMHLTPAVASHIQGTGTLGIKVACIGCHTFGLARDFEIARNGASTSHELFMDPVTNEVRPVVFKNGHAIAWYSHNWQTPEPSNCTNKCHYTGNLVSAPVFP